MARNKNSVNADYRRGFRIKLYPTDQQALFLDGCIDTSRYVYNWAVGKEREHYALYKDGKAETQQLGHKELRKLLRQHKKEELWLNEFPNELMRNSLKRVNDAYDMFFRHVTTAPPQFKTKKRSKKSFTTRSDRFHFNGKGIRIEGMRRGEYINIKHDFGFDKDQLFHNVVIVKDSTDTYWLTFSIDEVIDKSVYFEENKVKESEAIGIDLNKKQRYVLSNGTIYMAPDTDKLDSKIRRLERIRQKDISRSIIVEKDNPLESEHQYSNRAKKRTRRLNKLYKRKHNIVQNQIYEVSNAVCRMRPKAVVMEQLDSRHFFGNEPYMNSQLHGIPFLTMRLTMEYKCKQYGIPFILAPSDYPSSKRCSNCGNIKENFNRSQRIYYCQKCGYRDDRDINAAKNLQQLAY